MSEFFKILPRRMPESSLPAHATYGELIITTDTNRGFVGRGPAAPLAPLIGAAPTLGPISSFSKQPPTNLYSVPAAVGPFALTAVGAGQADCTVFYTGTISGVSRYSSLVGRWFVVTGFTNPENNGTFLCYGASPLWLALSNASSVAETINPSIADGLATEEVTNTAVASGIGCFGFSFEVAAAITVSQLGRQYLAGNSQNHNVNLWVNTDTVTPIASGTVLAASPSDSFGMKWVSITPVTLTPGVRYYIAVDENISDDTWQNLTNQFYLQLQFPAAVNTPCGVGSNIVAVAGATGAFPEEQAPVSDGFGIGRMYDTPAMMYTYTEGN